MKEKYVAVIGFVTGFTIIFIIFLCIVLNGGLINNYDYEHGDFAFAPHYVTFHIYPEQEGISVVAWATDDFPPTTGYTDNNSEVVFPMISSAEYNILIDGNKCSRYIYPTQSYYNITCGDIK